MPTLQSEPSLTLHARSCTGPECGGSRWCDYCRTFRYGGVVSGACRDCRDRWAAFPRTAPATWARLAGEHTGAVVDMTPAGELYAPLYVCQPCWGRNSAVSMHGTSVAAHVRDWHGPSAIACLRMLTADEHAAHGWDVGFYPEFIRA